MPSLISFIAGRCERRGAENWVDPQPARGLISLEQSNEDGLLHFQYTDLEANTVIEDLILFPGDATFSPIPSSSRVFVLKFASSSARHFYWMQDVSSTQDESRARRVNDLIADPEALEGWPAEDVEMSAPSSATARPTSADSAPSASAPVAPANAGLPSGITSDQMAQLQALIQQSAQAGGGSGGGSGMLPSVSLADILTPARLLSLISAQPDLAESLCQYLPPPTESFPHNLETLRSVLTSPELRKSARGLDQALTTGALSPIAMGLGLNEDETFGVENYLKGVQRLGDQEKQRDAEKRNPGGDSMQTD